MSYLCTLKVEAVLMGYIPFLKCSSKVHLTGIGALTGIVHQTLQILWGIAITRGHSNIESPINTMVKVIQMDDKLFKTDEMLFKWMKNCQIG
jgi:hypothetical protein